MCTRARICVYNFLYLPFLNIVAGGRRVGVLCRMHGERTNRLFMMRELRYGLACAQVPRSHNIVGAARNHLRLQATN
jgi:hypothetical protein